MATKFLNILKYNLGTLRNITADLIPITMNKEDFYLSIDNIKGFRKKIFDFDSLIKKFVYEYEHKEFLRDLIKNLPKDNSLTSMILTYSLFIKKIEKIVLVESVKKTEINKLKEDIKKILISRIKLLEGLKKSLYDYLMEDYKTYSVILKSTDNLIKLINKFVEYEDLNYNILSFYLMLRLYKLSEVVDKKEFREELELLDDLNAFIHVVLKEGNINLEIEGKINEELVR